MKEKRAITCGIFYCRDCAEINGCGSLQTSLRLDSDVLRSRQQNIPLSVSVHAKKPCEHRITRNKTVSLIKKIKIWENKELKSHPLM
jgi:hypothetical protein